MASNKELHYRAGVEFENHLNNLDVSGGIYLEIQKRNGKTRKGSVNPKNKG